MANKRVNELTEKSVVDGSDYLIVDSAAGGTKKLQMSTLIGALGSGARFTKTVDLAKTDSRTIAFNPTGYSYAATDTVDVYINGLHAIENTDYTLSVSGTSLSVVLTLTGTTGVTEKIEIIAIK